MVVSDGTGANDWRHSAVWDEPLLSFGKAALVILCSWIFVIYLYKKTYRECWQKWWQLKSVHASDPLAWISYFWSDAQCRTMHSAFLLLPQTNLSQNNGFTRNFTFVHVSLLCHSLLHPRLLLSNSHASLVGFLAAETKLSLSAEVHHAQHYFHSL